MRRAPEGGPIYACADQFFQKIRVRGTKSFIIFGPPGPNSMGDQIFRDRSPEVIGMSVDKINIIL